MPQEHHFRGSDQLQIVEQGYIVVPPSQFTVALLIVHSVIYFIYLFIYSAINHITVFKRYVEKKKKGCKGIQINKKLLK